MECDGWVRGGGRVWWVEVEVEVECDGWVRGGGTALVKERRSGLKWGVEVVSVMGGWR